MVSIGRVVKQVYEHLAGAAGKSVVIQIAGSAGNDHKEEEYQQHGISAGTTPESIAVAVRAGTKYVTIATHNYRVEVPVDPGQLRLYSTNAAGDTLAAEIALKPDGSIVINGGGKGAARTDDAVGSTTAEDAAFWTWVSTISAAVNALASGSVPSVPTSLTGKITGGSATVEVGD